MDGVPQTAWLRFLLKHDNSNNKQRNHFSYFCTFQRASFEKEIPLQGSFSLLQIPGRKAWPHNGRPSGTERAAMYPALSSLVRPRPGRSVSATDNARTRAKGD